MITKAQKMQNADRRFEGAPTRKDVLLLHRTDFCQSFVFWMRPYFRRRLFAGQLKDELSANGKLWINIERQKATTRSCVTY